MIRNKPKLVLTQIVSGERALTGLDKDGKVWTYLGGDYGWVGLNMNQLTMEQGRKAMDLKHQRTQQK